MAYTETSGLTPKRDPWPMAWGVLLIAAGLFAIAVPWIAGLTVEALVAWVILISGGFHLAHVLHESRDQGFVIKLLLAILYLLVGVFLIVHPVAALTTLTLLIGIFFLVEGAIEVGLFFMLRQSGAKSTWPLVNGIITLVLAALILTGWPASGSWVVGTFVGISLIFSGISRLSHSAKSRMAAI